jgi:hypothetical protein
LGVFKYTPAKTRLVAGFPWRRVDVQADAISEIQHLAKLVDLHQIQWLECPAVRGDLGDGFVGNDSIALEVLILVKTQGSEDCRQLAPIQPHRKPLCG